MPAAPKPTSETTLKRLVNELLEGGYTTATDAVIRAVVRVGGRMDEVLKALDAEAKRLEEAGKPLMPSNPLVTAVLATFAEVLRAQVGAVDGAAETVQTGGATAAGTLAKQLTLPGFGEAITAQWQAPDAAAIAQAVSYIGKSAWADEMGRFTENGLAAVNQIALAGIAQGWNPRRAAREIGATVNDYPLYAAHNLMRTLYLTSYRDSTSAYYVANANILDGQIRIGTLDNRICLCCLALHGTELAIGERVDDHHQGRCTSIGKVKGFDYNVRTGAEYWNALTFDEQVALGGFANANALRQGAVQLRDFVQPYTDPVFNQMLREASLKGLLNEQARQYYKNQQPV